MMTIVMKIIKDDQKKFTKNNLIICLRMKLCI